MGKGSSEVKVEETVNRIRGLMRKKDFYLAIRLGLTLYNNFFSIMNDYYKYVVTFNLALCYKKIEMYQEGLNFLEIALKYANIKEQGYYSIIWLINNCEIELKIDKKQNIINRFKLCLEYYKDIKDRQMTAHILYNMAKYKKNLSSMFRAFTLVIKEKDSIIPIFISYDKRAEVISILEDFKEIDMNLYERANNYLGLGIKTIDSN